MTSMHEIFLQRAFNHRYFLQPFQPLTWTKLQSLSTNPAIQSLSEDQLTQLWIKPVSRMLQYRFRIDQRNFTSTTTPTLSELTEDFELATVICIDKFIRNEEDLYGVERVGDSEKRWNHNIPHRVVALMERYERSGGRIERA